MNADTSFLFYLLVIKSRKCLQKQKQTMTKSRSISKKGLRQTTLSEVFRRRMGAPRPRKYIIVPSASTRRVARWVDDVVEVSSSSGSQSLLQQQIDIATAFIVGNYGEDEDETIPEFVLRMSFYAEATTTNPDESSPTSDGTEVDGETISDNDTWSSDSSSELSDDSMIRPDSETLTVKSSGDTLSLDKAPSSCRCPCKCGKRKPKKQRKARDEKN